MDAAPSGDHRRDCGGRNGRQVEETAAALTFRLSEEEFARINAFLEANPVRDLRSRIAAGVSRLRCALSRPPGSDDLREPLNKYRPAPNTSTNTQAFRGRGRPRHT